MFLIENKKTEKKILKFIKILEPTLLEQYSDGSQGGYLRINPHA
jgi:hypothetical protein